MARHGGLTRHGFVFRPGTNDEGIFLQMMLANDYCLPASFKAGDIVIDVGMHIGSFCYKALSLGSRHVYGFEPERSNYECAVRNLKQFGKRVQLVNKAVWRSDRQGDKLRFHSSHDKPNCGGGNVLWANSGPEIPTVAIDDVLREVTRDGRRRVRLLKIDCEGSEFPILLTSRLLHLIDEIAGEYHEYGGKFVDLPIPDHARVEGYDKFSIEDLTTFLERAGFRVTSKRDDTNLGMFHAVHESYQVPILRLKNPVPAIWESISKRLKAS